MSAFFIFDNIEVIDATKLQRYVAAVAPLVAAHGGHYRVLGGNPQIIEGDRSLQYPVVIEFDSVDQANAWYQSAAYQPLKALRHSAVRCNAVLLTGLPR